LITNERTFKHADQRSSKPNTEPKTAQQITIPGMSDTDMTIN